MLCRYRPGPFRCEAKSVEVSLPARPLSPLEKDPGIRDLMKSFGF